MDRAFRQISSLPDPGVSLGYLQENRAAALTICDLDAGFVHDKADARLLLDICGLLRPGILAARPRRKPQRRCQKCRHLRNRCKCGGT